MYFCEHYRKSCSWHIHQRILLDVYYCYANILLCIRTRVYYFKVIAIEWCYICMQSILRLLQKYSITLHCFLFTTFLMLKFCLIYTCMLFNVWTSFANSREKQLTLTDEFYRIKLKVKIWNTNEKKYDLILRMTS